MSERKQERIAAAIYARKSTAQEVGDDAKSVTRQISGAQTFIAAKGWTLHEAHIYTDDGVSGALFAHRAEFQRMMRDAAVGAFKAVVFYDLDRFGRQAQQTMAALHTLADLDITMWDFSTGREVDLNSFAGRVTTSLQAEFAQQFRDDIRKKTREAMYYKAAQGYVMGGLTYGYTNEGPKGQKRWKINEVEAAVVRRIYTLYAEGHGAREIAKVLNIAKVPKPRAQQGRADGWSASTIRAVLTRPTYRGEPLYGRTRKAYGRELKKAYPGTTREKGQIRVPQDDWTTITDPELAAQLAKEIRIVDDDLAARVDKRLADRRTRYLAAIAKNSKSAPHKAHGKYLLSGGMLICPTCGGYFEARKYPWKPSKKTRELLPPKARVGHPREVYICATRRRKPGVCNNTLALPIAETDNTILEIIKGEVLGTRYREELLAQVDRGEADNSAQLTAERDRLQAEVANLVKSIAVGVPADTVAPAIKEREMEIARLDVQLRRPRREPPNIEQLRKALQLQARQYKADLRAEPKIARLVLRRLVGPITLWDESERPDFVKWKAEPNTEILDGLAPTLLGTSPTGFEPVFQP